jgi:predicted AAA+ superfamily ATPase
MIIPRIIFSELEKVLKTYPVIVITGARQTGKTTLSKMIGGKEYINLESPDSRQLALDDPRLFLSRIEENGAIVDEFQRVPDLASYLQVMVDEKKMNGMFILTGSNNFLLMEKVSQSLAGRVAILKLMPLSYKEILTTGKQFSTNELLYRGFYPGVHAANMEPTRAYANYYQTYLERDVRQLINIKDIHLFQRFIQLCAGRIGQLFNMEQLANETGISNNTVKSWISVLEASHLVFLLQPWYENINKRIVKSPKLYFNDVGLASYLLGIEEVVHIQSHPLRGVLFENLVIIEYLKYRFNKGLGNNAFFYRDNHQNEIDLVFKSGISYTLVEIKSAQTYHSNFRAKLDWFAKLLPNAPTKKVVVYDGEQEWKNEEISIVNWRNFIDSI